LRIAVLEVHQARTDHPKLHVKKSVAQMLCRQLLAVWVTRTLIQRVTIKAQLAPASLSDRYVAPQPPDHPMSPLLFLPALRYPLDLGKDRRTRACGY
jgi:hypothetical protein